MVAFNNSHIVYRTIEAGRLFYFIMDKAVISILVSVLDW